MLNGQLRKMSDRDLLAIILGSGVAGTNVKQVATTVIRRFGENLLTASPNDLRNVRGIGEVKAARLAAAFELYRKLSNGIGSHAVRTIQDVQWLCHDIAREKQEILGYLALDIRNHLIKNEPLYRGTESVTVADPKHIFRSALNTGAHSIIIYHNHPCGSLEPSKPDLALAARLAQVGAELNLPVLDFIILTKDGIHSLLGRNTDREEPVYAAEEGQQITLTAILGHTTTTDVSHKPQTGTGFTFIDLFAGIGGIRLAFEAAGGNCVFSCEWDTHAQKTYERNFGEIPWGDIRDITGETKTDANIQRLIPDHDVLTAGFPCQPFSLAGVSKKNSLGRKHGFDDPTQGTLFFDLKRILKVKRPAAFFLENVKHLVHHDNGKTFEIIRRTLEDELGYVVRWQIVDAAKWVPQSRKRIFIVGYNLDRIRITKEEIIIPTKPGRGYRYPELNRIIQREVDEKYMLGPGTWATLERHKKHHAEAGNGFGYGLLTFPIPDGTVTRTISARYHKDGAEILVQTGNLRPRRLTVEEAAQLQGYPKRFIFPVSDTQVYRQIGNSVAVPSVEAAARHISEILKERK